MSDASVPSFPYDPREIFPLVAQNSAIGLCLTSAEGLFLWVNPAMCMLMSRPEQDLLRMTWQDITHPDDIGGNQADAARIISGAAETFRTLKRYIRADGSILWGDLSVASLRGPDGTFRMFVGQILDVTDQVRAREELASSQDRYRLLAENASDVVSRTSQGIIQWISPSVTELLGWVPDELVGTRSRDLVHPDDLDRILAGGTLLPTRESMDYRLRVRRADGSYRWVGITGRPIADETGRVIGQVAGWRDAEAEVAAERALAASEERYRLLAENACDVVVAVDPGGRIDWVSPSVAPVLGFAKTDLDGSLFLDLVHPEDRQHLTMQKDSQGLAVAEPGHAVAEHREVRVRTAAGGWLWMEDAWNPWVESGGEIHALRDAQGEHEAREQLHYLAYHDCLTSLATRAVAEDHLEKLLAQGPRNGSLVAVLFIDMDDLKAINDELGHAAGDAAIRCIAERLKSQARSEDLVARFGGDEFVVILPAVRGRADVLAVANKILAAAVQPIRIDDVEVRTGVSIGAALTTRGTNRSDVLRRADAALYLAKRSGRNRTVLDDRPETWQGDDVDS